MIGGPVPGKSANDESLARDEAGGSNQHLQDANVTYKTVQGRQLRMTPAMATLFSRPLMQLRAEPLSSEGERV